MLSWKKGRERFASTASIAANKGLLNEPGENNCFLNSAIQVLWHLDVFRRSFRLLNGHACMGPSCIFCALKDIFQQFQHSKAQALPPNVLRSALAETFQQQNRFQLGLMDDAAEVFENILLRMHVHIGNTVREDVCTASHCIPHQKFGLSLVEQCVCCCGATSEPLPFIEMVHYVSATALCVEDEIMRNRYGTSANTQMFGHLIRVAGSWGDVRSCPSECGAKVDIRKVLMNCPDVVSIGIVWDSEESQVQHIVDLLHALGTTLRLSDLFHTVVDERASRMELYLVGMVCYYGKHYSTFFFHTKLRKWVYFDDAQVSEVGKRWSNVISKCIKGHHQPLLLLYANPDATPISAETAPKVTTMLPGYYTQNGGVSEKYNQPVFGDPQEKDSLSSGGDTSYLEEESSGTESTQATNSMYSPPPPSKSRSQQAHRHAVKDTRGSAGRQEKQSTRPSSDHHVRKRADRARDFQPTSEMAAITGQEAKLPKQKSHGSVPAAVVTEDKRNVPARTREPFQPNRNDTPKSLPAAQPVQQPKKPVFQWNMASEKPSTRGDRVGHYVEPSPAQWTKYKPYPQTNKNMSKSKTLAATATRPVSNPSPKMETKSTSATRLAYEHADDTSSQRASPTPVQPPHRPLRFQARSAQGSQRSSLSSQRSRISQASTSSAASSRTKSPSPLSTEQVTVALSDTDQEADEPIVTAVDGTEHCACDTAKPVASRPTFHRKRDKPPLPPKPPCLGLSKPSVPTSATPTLTPTPAPRLSCVNSIPSVASPSTTNTYTFSNGLSSLANTTSWSSTPTVFGSLIPQTFPNLQQLTHHLLGNLSHSHLLTSFDPSSVPAPPSTSVSVVTESSAKATGLLQNAHDLMEKSKTADTLLDYSSALQLCLEATKLIETVMLLPDVSNEHMLKARLLHGQCVSKARILQRRKVIRQQNRKPTAGGNRSSMTEADRHMAAPTNQVHSDPQRPNILSQPSVEEMEKDERNENLICFDKPAVTNLQHHVTKLYAQQDRARQHPNYRMPVTVLAHTSNSNSNNNNNSRSDSSKSGTSVQPDDISSRMLSKDSSEPEQERTNIFVWNRPIETGSPSSKVLDTEQGASALSSNVVGAQQRPLHRQLSSDQSRQESFLVSGSSAVNSVPSSADEEIVKSTQSMSLETAKQKFRSKTPTPQTGPGISVAAQHRRSKTPTPMSNKALLRARAAGQLPSVAPVARQNSTPDAPLSVVGDDPASSDNPVAPPRRRGNQRGGDVTSPPTKTPEAPQFPVNPQIFPSWPIPNTVMFPASFNPTMASSNYHPYMYEMWKFYASLSPEQRSLMFPTANQQLSPPVLPPMYPFVPPMAVQPAVRLPPAENTRSQLGRNLKNFTSAVGQIPAQARVENTNFYEASKPKPKPIAKTEPAPSQSGSDSGSVRSAKLPGRRPPVESRPNLKFVRTPAHEAAPQSSSHRQVPAGGHAPKQRVPNANRDQRSEDSVPQGEGMLKWAEEAKKRAPMSGIPPELKNRLINEYTNRARREREQSDPKASSSGQQGALPAKQHRSGETSAGQTHGCELCGLTQVPLSVKYCDSCKAYLARFKPTANSLRAAGKS